MRLRNRANVILMACLLTFVSAALVAKVSGFGQPQIGAVKGTMPILKNIKVVNFGTTVYTGSMDVNPTINRIRQGTKVNERNDGGIFTNVQRILPVSSDSQYYREFVHYYPLPNGAQVSFPGPQRLVIGKNGVVYYTGDHYSSFHRVN